MDAWSRRTFLVACAGVAAVGVSGPVSAQLLGRRRRRMRRRALQRFKRRGGLIQERARDAVQRGDIRPLREVMRAVRARSDAEVLDVDLHEHPRGWIYALRVLTQRGRIRDVFLDGRTLEVLHFGESGDEDGIPLPRELSVPRSTTEPVFEPSEPPPLVTPPPLPSRRPR